MVLNWGVLAYGFKDPSALPILTYILYLLLA